MYSVAILDRMFSEDEAVRLFVDIIENFYQYSEFYQTCEYSESLREDEDAIQKKKYQTTDRLSLYLKNVISQYTDYSFTPHEYGHTGYEKVDFYHPETRMTELIRDVDITNDFVLKVLLSELLAIQSDFDRVLRTWWYSTGKRQAAVLRHYRKLEQQTGDKAVYVRDIEADEFVCVPAVDNIALNTAYTIHTMSIVNVTQPRFATTFTLDADAPQIIEDDAIELTMQFFERFFPDARTKFKFFIMRKQ